MRAYQGLDKPFRNTTLVNDRVKTESNCMYCLINFSNNTSEIYALPKMRPEYLPVLYHGTKD